MVLSGSRDVSFTFHVKMIMMVHLRFVAANLVAGLFGCRHVGKMKCDGLRAC